MKKRMVILIGMNIIFGVLSVFFSMSNHMSSSMIREGREELADLEHQYAELKAEHLKLVLDQLEPRAREAGFVAVSEPRFIRTKTSVGFVSGR